MSIKSVLILSATVAVIAGISTASMARPIHSSHNQGFTVSDTKGNVLFDDGKLDGKGCVIGNKVIFNPVTGQLELKPALKCIGF